MQVGLVQKLLKLDDQHPAYNTVHLHNPTSLWELSYMCISGVVQVDVKACTHAKILSSYH